MTKEEMMEAWHQDTTLSNIRYNELISVTNDHYDLLVSLTSEGMETLNRVLTRAMENKAKGIGNSLRMDNAYWIDRYTQKGK